ncbi:hypothetical protein [Halpernia frigidisoli]|uniref:Uncharacterized protein n=1 Tax=Halpernia frigidisoli TaxID=1125876 RepID=A0A1I3HJ82_9FLAO|nr:hypothetical protein [Halpernia frigidisoli]SFI35796.1 hypothetical protein SAMN05443292_2244 [Halpernia frigidisoli]
MVKRNLLFLGILLCVNCCSSKQYFEVRQPFKNYTYNQSYLLPLNTIKSDYIFRIWFFDSTSVDKVLVVFKNEKNEFESQLISFGKVHDGKKFKEVYTVVDVKPKNGFGNLIEHLQNDSLAKYEDRTDNELVNDESVYQYFFELKFPNEQNSFKYVTSKSQFGNENKYSYLIKYLKSEFNLNFTKK